MTITQKNRIAQLEQQLAELRDQALVEAFANRVAVNIMLVLASTPFQLWPKSAKVAYYREAEKTPMVAKLYRSRLD